MTDNPYRPSNSIQSARKTQVAIYWKSVLIGFAIGFVGGCILAIIWGLAGIAVHLAVGSSAGVFYESTVASIIGWCVGLVPFSIGLVYVCATIDDSRVSNCLIVAALSVATSIPFLFFDEDPFEWTVAIYYIIEFLLAIIIGTVWTRRHT